MPRADKNEKARVDAIVLDNLHATIPREASDLSEVTGENVSAIAASLQRLTRAGQAAVAIPARRVNTDNHGNLYVLQASQPPKRQTPNRRHTTSQDPKFIRW